MLIVEIIKFPKRKSYFRVLHKTPLRDVKSVFGLLEQLTLCS